MKNKLDRLRFVDLKIVDIKETKIPALMNSSYHHIVLSYDDGLTLKINKKLINLKKQDLMFLESNQQIEIVSSKCEYCLIDFVGEIIDDLLSLNSIERRNICINNYDNKLNTYINEIFDNLLKTGSLNIYSLGVFYQLLYYVVEKAKIAIEKKSLCKHVKKAKRYIELNYSEDITITELASYCSISPNYLANIFHKEMNMTTKAYLTKIRMEQARKLLLSNNYSIREVSKKVGFKDPLYFSSAFKKYFKISPTLIKND